MNLYKTSISIDNFISSIIYNNESNLKKLIDQSMDNGYWNKFILILLPDNIDLDNFLASFNKLSPSIKLTIEKESNNSIPFLDVQVIRGENNRPQFKIYRKPTLSNLYIYAFSGHSDKIKEAANNNIFQRAYKLCDPQILNHEIEFIYKIFKNLWYEKYFINRAYHKGRLAYYKTRNKEKNITRRLIYHQNVKKKILVNLFHLM